MMPLSTEVGLGPGDIVLDGDPAYPTERDTAGPYFSDHVYCGQAVVHLSNCRALVRVILAQAGSGLPRMNVCDFWLSFGTL